MENRFSIYAGTPMVAALAALGQEGINRSGRLNTVCERYMAMVTDALARLDLSRGEWCAVMDANNGVQEWTGDPWHGTMLWANVADTPGLGEKWGVDQEVLVARLRALGKTDLIAVQEVCDRFWSHADLPTDDALAQAGVCPRA
jgi:hypothetical protein